MPGAEAPRLVALLGGTIGNFPPGTRRGVLRRIAGLLGAADRLLLGTDLVKDPAVLEAAYNDSAGVTAAFNRNVLHVINRELGADFIPEAFEHVAFFDRRHEWIEMRLRAQRPMSVNVADLGLRVEFAAGEELRTEISCKFTRERVAGDLAAAGLELERWLTDEEGRFAVTVARLSRLTGCAARPTARARVAAMPEELSPADRSSLAAEQGPVNMAVGGLMVFAAEPP